MPLPFVHKQLLLPLKAGGHIPSACLSLEPPAESPDKAVPPRGRAALGHGRALFQGSSHLLENKARPSHTFSGSRCFSVPGCGGRKPLGLPVSPNQDPETGLGERAP